MLQRQVQRWPPGEGEEQGGQRQGWVAGSPMQKGRTRRVALPSASRHWGQAGGTFLWEKRSLQGAAGEQDPARPQADQPLCCREKRKGGSVRGVQQGVWGDRGFGRTLPQEWRREERAREGERLGGRVIKGPWSGLRLCLDSRLGERIWAGFSGGWGGWAGRTRRGSS